MKDDKAQRTSTSAVKISEEKKVRALANKKMVQEAIEAQYKAAEKPKNDNVEFSFEDIKRKTEAKGTKDKLADTTTDPLAKFSSSDRLIKDLESVDPNVEDIVTKAVKAASDSDNPDG